MLTSVLLILLACLFMRGVWSLFRYIAEHDGFYDDWPDDGY